MEKAVCTTEDPVQPKTIDIKKQNKTKNNKSTEDPVLVRAGDTEFNS